MRLTVSNVNIYLCETPLGHIKTDSLGPALARPPWKELRSLRLGHRSPLRHHRDCSPDKTWRLASTPLQYSLHAPIRINVRCLETWGTSWGEIYLLRLTLDLSGNRPNFRTTGKLVALEEIGLNHHHPHNLMTPSPAIPPDTSRTAC